MAPQQPALKRAIGPNALLLFVLGDVLGAGIYVLVGQVAGEVGGAIWVSFLVALVLAFFTACSYAELVTKYPGAGGAALYVNRAFKQPFVTFMVMFAVMLSGITSASTLARAFAGDYLEALVSVPTLIAALAFIAVVALINARGIEQSVRVNVLLTLVELGGLLLITIVGVAALADGQGDASRAIHFDGDGTLVWSILGGATLAFYALIGFEDSVNVSEEDRDPRHHYPRALFAALALAGVIYAGIAVVASMVVPTGTLADSSGPLLEVVQVGPLAVSTKVFSAIALLAVANGALINMIMASRLLYGMSNEGIVPHAFGFIGRRGQTPLAAIAFTTVLAAALITLGDLASLARTTVLLLLLVFAAVNVSVLVLRRDRTGGDHFRTPRAFPVLGLAVIALLLARTEAESYLLAGPLLLLGALLYLVTRRLVERENSPSRPGEVPTTSTEISGRRDDLAHVGSGHDLL
jgi:basic amino acid/polyamine antiporter, APA family